MIELNEKNIKRKNNLYLLKSLFLIKKNYPHSDTYFFVLFFLKYTGIIVLSRVIEMVTNKDTISFNKYFKNLFLFGNDFSSMHKNYFTISIFGAILILIYFIYTGFCIFYMRYKYKDISSIIDEKAHGTNEKFEDIIFKILSYCSIFLTFFHHYIIEYYSFGIFAFIYDQLGIATKIGTSEKYTSTIDPELIEYLENNNHIPILIINIIVIITIIGNFTFYIMINSVRGLFLRNGIFCGNIKFAVMKIIMCSFQPFFILTRFYSDDNKIIIGIIFDVIIFILSLMNIFNCFNEFCYYPNKIADMCLFIDFFVMVSSIDEIIIYYVGYKESTIFFFVKLLLELVNSYVLINLFNFLKERKNVRIFAKNLFSKNSTDISRGGLYHYMKVFLEYQKDKNINYIKIFRILLQHIKFCKKIECPGQKLVPKEYLQSAFVPFSLKEKADWKNNIFRNRESIKEKKDEDLIESKSQSTHVSEKSNIILDEKTERNNENKRKKENSIINIEKKKLTEKQFQIIFEQEIMNRIEYLFKTRKFSDLERFIFIHLQYLYMMKKNYSLTLYYLGKYEKCGIKWNFITQYFLYEYKISIIHSYFNKLNTNSPDKTVNKFRKDNLFMTEIVDYFALLALLKKLIISSCDKLKTLFAFRKNLHNPLILKTYKHSNTNEFFKKGEELKYNINKILNLTKSGLNQTNKDNISAELSYIISNFLLITLNKIPEDLRKIINPAFDINIISSKLEAGYKSFNLVHPLILQLTKNNTFNIIYFSCVISNRLGFHQHELKDKDFHEKLFPGVKFIKQHELLMKQFLFFSYNTYAKANTFIKTKDGYLLGVSVEAKKFPSFYEEFLLIIGLDFNDKLFYSKINKSFNRYSFLLDENSEFIAETKNFYEDFEFNINMFKEIKTNFFEFFCVDKNNIIEKIRKKNNELYKQGVNNIYNLKREEDAFTIFKNISYEKAYELRDISKLENINKNYVKIHDIIQKEKIIRLIPEFSKLIEEYGLDFEWYQHLQNLNDRLSIKELKNFSEEKTENSFNTLIIGQTFNNTPQGLKGTSINSITQTNINNLNNLTNIITKKESKENNNNIGNESIGRPSYTSISSNSKKNFYNKIIRITLDRDFDVVYNLKKMGSVYFYIVDLYERTMYLDDNFNSVKKKYSFNNNNNNKKNVSKLMNINEETNENNNNKLIKAKTLFNEKPVLKKKIEFGQKKVVINEEPIEIKPEQKGILKLRTWENNENLINNINEQINMTSNNNNIKIDEERKANLIIKRASNEGINFPRKSRRDLKFNSDLIDKSDYHYDNFNISSSYNYRSSKEQDEENISLISKNQIDELRKKSDNINRIYIIMLIIFFSLTIVVISVKLYYASTNFSYILNLTSALIFLEEIKTDIYTGSMVVISQCLRINSNDTPTGMNNMFFQLAIKGQDLMTHINSFEKQLILIKDNSLLSNIRKLLYKNITIEHLNIDWSTKTNQSYLFNEINYFAYLLNIASQTLEITCDFDSTFFLLSELEDTREIYERTHQESKFNQKFIYYVLKNIIYEIQPVIMDIIEELMIALISTFRSYLDIVIVIYICLFIIVIAIEVIFLIKNKSDIYFIKQVFLFLYNYENNQLKKEYEINFLEKVAKEFNLNNLVLLEKIKKDNNFFFSLISSNFLSNQLN